MISALTLLTLIPLLATASPLIVNRQLEDLNYIHPTSDLTKCLDIVSTPANGVAVGVRTCDYKSTLWHISKGLNTVIRESSLNYCLDVGTQDAPNFTNLKVWQCYPGVAQQSFYFTDDNHIAVTGATTCLDSGIGADGQTAGELYTCIGGNANQLWSLGKTIDPNPPVTTTTSVSATATATTSTPPVTSTAPVTTATRRFIHPNGNTEQCLTVNGGYAANNANVAIVLCSDSPFDNNVNALQLWEYVVGAPTTIKLSGTNYCLDATTQFPANGAVVAKIYTCFPDVPQQQFYVTADNHIAVLGGDSCLDVVADSKPTQTKPNGTLKDVSWWQCSGPDTLQLWTGETATF